MLFGRFFMIVPVLALAGNLAQKEARPGRRRELPRLGARPSPWSWSATVLIVGALTFLPALALGPIVEHFLMTGSEVLY